MVARGLGVGVLFESSIAAELEEGSLVRVPVAAAPLHEAFCVATSRVEPLLPAAEGLVAFIRSQLKHAFVEYKPSLLEL
jgi:DNA-binding transcriptional LysR family regulator